MPAHEFPTARVFLRAVDSQTGQVVDIIGRCEAIEVDANYTHLGRRYVADVPLGSVRFEKLTVEAFLVAEPGHSIDRFLHDDSLPSADDINRLRVTPWWQKQGEGLHTPDLVRLIDA